MRVTRNLLETRWVRAWVRLFTRGCGHEWVWEGVAIGFLSNPPQTCPVAIPMCKSQGAVVPWGSSRHHHRRRSFTGVSPNACRAIANHPLSVSHRANLSPSLFDIAACPKCPTGAVGPSWSAAARQPPPCYYRPSLESRHPSSCRPHLLLLRVAAPTSVLRP
jgi:hypothetical protein